MTYRADTGSPTGVFLHIKIHWWLIAWANGQGDALDRTTTFEYDAAGNVTKVIDPAFREIRFTYDAVFNRVTTITDALNQVTEFTYDSTNGNLLTTTDPLGNATQRAIAAREPDRSPAIADTVPLRWLEPRDGDRGRKTGNHQIRLRWQCGLGTGSGTICAQRP